MVWVDPWSWVPWKRGKFNEWFNSANVNNIIKKKDAVSAALRGTGENMNYFLFLWRQKQKS